MKVIPKHLFRKWLHSYEEDSEDFQVFRPNDYRLPPSRRPRDGYKFCNDGQVIMYVPSPTDALEAVEGKFELIGDNVMTLHFDDKVIKEYSLQILSCDEKSLSIKMISGMK